MTREEAKVILALMTREQELSVNTDKSNFEALNMAIEALEQEPCEDCVSREKVFEMIDDCDSDGLTGIFCSYADGERFKKYIKELPSVKLKAEQEPKTNVLDKIRAEIEELYSYVEFDEDLKTSFNMIRLEDVQKVLDKYKAESENT